MMKIQTFYSFLALATGLQQATATWSNAPSYKCPKSNPDHCIPDQVGGYNWRDLEPGFFNDYKGLKWFGWTCSDKFIKRDGLVPRTNPGFQNKCITGTAHPQREKCPSFSCGNSGISSFSIDIIKITVEYDCVLEFLYDMDDGSTCRHKSSCSAGGSIVKNSQCGGAKNVTVVLASPPPSKPTCDFAIHGIDFYCPTTTKSVTTATTSPPKSTTKPPAQTTTTSVYSTSTSASSSSTSVASSAAASSSSTGASSSSAGASRSSTGTASSSAGAVSSSAGTTSSAPASNSSAPAQTSSAPVTTSTAGPVTTAPAASTTTPVSITTVVIDTTVTTCPVTNVVTSGGVTTTQVSQTVSTIFITRTSTICHKCTGTPAPVPASSAPAAQPTAPCPSILPSCLNTWITETKCSSNTDSSCYCPSANITALIFECLYARGSSDDEIFVAQIYFQGLCAPFVPQNPAIVTAASPVTPTATVYSGPATTITIMATIVVPCTLSNTPTTTYSVVPSTVTVPQVVIQTNPSAVGLVPGSATATPVNTPTSFAVVPTVASAGRPTTTNTAPPKFTGAASRPGMGLSVAGAAFALAVFAV